MNTASLFSFSIPPEHTYINTIKGHRGHSESWNIQTKMSETSGWKLVHKNRKSCTKKNIFKGPDNRFSQSASYNEQWDLTHTHFLEYFARALFVFLVLSLLFLLVWSGQGSVGKMLCHVFPCTNQSLAIFKSMSLTSPLVVAYLIMNIKAPHILLSGSYGIMLNAKT